MNRINIPTGRMADDAALAAKRAELKRKLLEGGKITLKKDGGATGGAGEASSISIPQGKLADDAALAAKRAELKRKLLEGGKITLKKDGGATGGAGEASSISIPQGKLAAQWYENDPELLEMEKIAMARAFNGFELGKLDDGRLYWIGDVTPGVYKTKYGEDKTYTIMAVYQNNHPQSRMGSTVFIYPVLPDIDEMKREIGYRPHHLLVDSDGNEYLCTARAEDVKTGSTVTTAASVVAWAVKWLTCYELVLTGNMTRDEFDHGVQ